MGADKPFDQVGAWYSPDAWAFSSCDGHRTERRSWCRAVLADHDILEIVPAGVGKEVQPVRLHGVAPDRETIDLRVRTGRLDVDSGSAALAHVTRL